MSQHSDRIDAIVLAFEKSHEHFVSELATLDEAAAQRPPAKGGWSPAQIGWHVGVTNEQVSAIVTGELPRAQLAKEGYTEQGWGSMTIPDQIQTLPQLEPPNGITRKEALERLEAGATRLIAALRSLSSARASSYVVHMPFGVLSMYQLGEFAGLHVDRHAAQLERAVGKLPV